MAAERRVGRRGFLGLLAGGVAISATAPGARARVRHNCGAIGRQCTANRDCCSDTCIGVEHDVRGRVSVYGACSPNPDPLPGCLPDGNPCTNWTDCCSLGCAAGLCADPTGPVQGRTGEASDSGDGAPVDGPGESSGAGGGDGGSGGSCLPAGSACSEWEQCCSATCVNGVCGEVAVPMTPLPEPTPLPQCMPLDGACREAGGCCVAWQDCCSESCANGTCA